MKCGYCGSSQFTQYSASRTSRFIQCIISCKFYRFAIPTLLLLFPERRGIYNWITLKIRNTLTPSPSTSAGSKIRKNNLSNVFAFLENGTLRNGVTKGLCNNIIIIPTRIDFRIKFFFY